jgi:hypothetical protein
MCLRWFGSSIWRQNFLTGGIHLPVWLCGWTCVWPNFNYFFFAKIECGLYLLDRFDVLMSKIIFKKWKNIIDIYFGTKSYLKSNHYHTAKHALNELADRVHIYHLSPIFYIHIIYFIFSWKHFILWSNFSISLLFFSFLINK